LPTVRVRGDAIRKDIGSLNDMDSAQRKSAADA